MAPWSKKLYKGQIKQTGMGMNKITANRSRKRTVRLSSSPSASASAASASAASASASEPPREAIAVFQGNLVTGTVTFKEIYKKNSILVQVNLAGLTPNSMHGFHVHQAGDLTDQCQSLCAHFNPYGKHHGCPGKTVRHVGDLGNLVVDENGRASYSFIDKVIRLRGEVCNIIGRGLIVHEDKDDCGDGGNEESLKTGNAGKRIACAIIGYSKTNFCS